MKRQSKTNHGFTFIELMVAIAVFGILILAAIPSTLDWRKNQRANAAATAIMYDVLQAKNMAVQNNADVILTFDLANHVYRMYLDTNGLGIDVSNLAKVQPLTSIEPSSRFGFIPGTGLDGNSISQSVVMGNTSNPVRCIIKPNGQVIHPGIIYTIPVYDMGSIAKRQRAIQISSTGRVSRWDYTNPGDLIPWKEHL